MKKISAVVLSLILLISLGASCYAANTVAYNKGERNIVLTDSSDLYIEISDYGFEPMNNEYTVEMLIVNKTGIPIEYGTDYAAVNGYIVNSYMYGVSAADRRDICYLEIISDDIYNLGLDAPDVISFHIYVNLTEESGNRELYADDVTLNVSGRSLSDSPTRTFEDFPSELTYCNEFIRFEVYDAKQVEGSPFYQLDCVAENPNQFDITLSCSNVNVDGIYTEPYWLCRIPAGYCILTSIFIDAEELAAYGVTDFDHISFSLMIYEGFQNLWDTENTSQPFFAYPLSFYPAKG